MPELAGIPSAEQVLIDIRLAEQTRRLAEVPRGAGEGRTIEVLVCRVGLEEYALELRLLKGVYPAVGLTPVPCTSLVVAGLLNLRGEIVTVLDLAAALGLTGSDQCEVLLAETPRVRVGLLVGEVLGVRQIALGALDRAIPGSDYTRGIAEARSVLLDLEGLLADRRFEPMDDRRETFAT